jgi:eukaryotic-like serine/threonine-protein kinase
MPLPLATLAAALADRYRIDRELGAGGMATVYLALDLKHQRRVAVKVLRPELAAALGPERFLREIETTANLRHPHILPLYDSGRTGGQADGRTGDFLFYVMPYVEGESLRDRLNREKQLPIEDAVRIAREVADALGYAHGRQIVHRDIKPENILLESGHAVVADFGIARAISAAGGDRLTETGLAVGTAQYMSPEQAAAEKDLDGRSDLYSLGCVLYEMLAGQAPFTGPTAESVVRQHLLATPPPITQLRPAVSAEIAGVIQRMLAKSRADRFTTAGQFADALGREGPAVTRSGEVPRAGAPHRRYAVGAAALGIVAVLGIGLLLLTRRASSPLPLGRRIQVTLDPGLELDPALSSDGKFVAYSGPHGELLVRQVEGGVPIPVIREGEGKGRWPAWTPDDQRLVFVSPRGVEVVPALGGEPRLLVAGTGLARGVTVSPDGRSFAFVRHDSIYARPLGGGDERALAAGAELHSLAWSPDGRWIAFVSGNIQYVSTTGIGIGNIAPSSVHLVAASGGLPIRISDQQSLNVSPAWASDRLLLYVSNREGGRDVYQVRLTGSGSPAGAPLRVTTGLNPHGIAVSLDGRRLAYSAFTETSNVWSAPIPTSGALSVSQAQPVTVGNQTIENVGVSTDGRWIAYSSDRSGTNQLYRQRVGDAGAQPRQVTVDTADSFWAAWSPDDRQIAFHRFQGERRQIFVIAAEGGVPVPVTDGSEDERSPEWSPDGRRLLLLANWGTKAALHITSVGADGHWSAPRELPVVIGSDTLTGGLGAWSPDGRSLACGCGSGGLVIVPVEGGSARRLPSPYSSAGWAFPQWSEDGRTVYHLVEDSGRVTAAVAVPVSGGAARILLRFDDPTRPWHRFGFRARAGRFYFTLGDLQSDIWVAEVEHQ